MNHQDVCVVNATVLPMTGREQTFDAVRWRDGRIVAVGSRDEVLDSGGSPEIIDAEGGTIIPGILDAHAHLEMLAYSWEIAVDVRSTVVSSIEDIVRILRERALAEPDGGWILGQGEHYQDLRLSEGRYPDSSDLDRVSLDRPVIYRASYHINVFNSKGLELLGVTKDTPDALGGRIERHPSTGELTGRTYDMFAALNGPQAPVEVLRDAIARVQQRYLRLGVTTVGDIPLHSHALDALLALSESGGLLLRAAVYPKAPTVMSIGDIELVRDRFAEHDPRRLRFAGVKMFLDGGLTSGAAALHEDYPEEPGYRGELAYTQEEVAEFVAAVDRAGLQVAIHAIGDRALDVALDAIAQVPGSRHGRHRIEHAGNLFMTRERIARIRELGVVPVPQPAFILTTALGYEQHLGRARVGSLMPFRDMLDGGLRIPGNSDAIGISADQHNPYVAMQAIVSRLDHQGRPVDPEQAVTPYEALESYTRAGAYSLGWEQQLGSLEPGKAADLVLLDENPLEVRAEAIGDLSVRTTWIGGEAVYSR